MTKKGFLEHSSFYSSLICSFANTTDVKMAEELMIEAEGKKMLKDQATFLKFILMYIEEGMMEMTLDVAAVNAKAKVSVKLVAKAGIGTLASRVGDQYKRENFIAMVQFFLNWSLPHW
ncbi:hypothetical protein POM88_028827 [Heracleum sosnowskyi]|uniref:Uncharacterized protein n=1 Tax=Heracleum sosnowskyi TaxID=360622 RepID=A0AAD8MH37_9APIA|nr:hypothetical protein POM88_028827 [Heracleum sosnowskyi]